MRRILGAIGWQVLAFGLIAGCGKKSEDQTETPTNVENLGKKEQPLAQKAAVRDRLHQSFAEAVHDSDDPPADAERPPDQTITNKPVAALYNQIKKAWDSVRFTTLDGKKISYAAKVETEWGNIEIALFPEVAPNHVRNFILLAQAGYYDGLVFDRIRIEEGLNTSLRSIEGGCPLGTGNTPGGSIGYWLKPEPQGEQKITHDEGVVGACRGAEEDSAACRFYITLSKAPFLDGNFTAFGKITQGLDLARKISVQPVIMDDEDPNDAHRPEKPVKIKKVTITTAIR
jgi:peptidyl-prolyl cis-trans isomerase B (cyclophilin B)